MTPQAIESSIRFCNYPPPTLPKLKSCRQFRWLGRNTGYRLNEAVSAFIRKHILKILTYSSGNSISPLSFSATSFKLSLCGTFIMIVLENNSSYENFMQLRCIEYTTMKWWNWWKHIPNSTCINKGQILPNNVEDFSIFEIGLNLSNYGLMIFIVLCALSLSTRFWFQ